MKAPCRRGGAWGTAEGLRLQIDYWRRRCAFQRRRLGLRFGFRPRVPVSWEEQPNTPDQIHRQENRQQFSFHMGSGEWGDERISDSVVFVRARLDKRRERSGFSPPSPAPPARAGAVPTRG